MFTKQIALSLNSICIMYENEYLYQEQPYFYTKKNSPPLTGIGSYRDNSEQSDGFQNTSINKSDKLSGTTVAGVIVGVICLISLVSGYVYFLQRNPHNEEKDHILKRRPLLYTKI